MPLFSSLTPRLLALAVPLFIPLVAFAQTIGLVPCGNTSGNYVALGGISEETAKQNYLTATACNLCDLVTLVQNIVNFLIMVSIPISVALFAWAGILYFTSAANPKGVARAKKIFSAVFIGFGIALSGWLVVQVILQSITNSNFFVGSSWTNIQCVDPKHATDGNRYSSLRPREAKINSILEPIDTTKAQTPPPAPANSGAPMPELGQEPVTPPGPTEVDTTPVGSPEQDAANRRQLTAAGIPVESSGNCNNPAQSNCTALDRANQNIIDATIQVAQNSGQSIKVTGGNEVGHQNSQQTNGNSVDISFQNDALKFNSDAINSVIQAAQAKGQCAVWEPGVVNGVPNQCPAGVKPCLPNYGTNGHFSLYMSPSASPSCNL
ncbi:MAG: pilin [Candidatus Adlerbacteria bacterium]